MTATLPTRPRDAVRLVPAGDEITVAAPSLCIVLAGRADVIALAEPVLAEPVPTEPVPTESVPTRRPRLLRIVGPSQLILLPLEAPSCLPAAELRLVAARDCALDIVAWDDVERLYAENPQRGARLLATASRTTRELQNAVLTWARNDVGARLARELTVMTRRYGRRLPGGGVLIEHGLPQSALADLVGSSRETVCRALGRFAARGWVRVGTTSITVLQPERLAARAR